MSDKIEIPFENTPLDTAEEERELAKRWYETALLENQNSDYWREEARLARKSESEWRDQSRRLEDVLQSDPCTMIVCHSGKADTLMALGFLEKAEFESLGTMALYAAIGKAESSQDWAAIAQLLQVALREGESLKKLEKFRRLHNK